MTEETGRRHKLRICKRKNRYNVWPAVAVDIGREEAFSVNAWNAYYNCNSYATAILDRWRKDGYGLFGEEWRMTTAVEGDSEEEEEDEEGQEEQMEEEMAGVEGKVQESEQ